MSHPGLAAISIVDDDASVRGATCSLLRSYGYRAETFSSAELFLESDALQGTDCLIVDVRMSGIDGIELQRRLNTAQSGIPVIFVSAHDDGPARQKAIEAGAVDFLRKPFDANALVAAIEISQRGVAKRVGGTQGHSAKPTEADGLPAKRAALAKQPATDILAYKESTTRRRTRLVPPTPQDPRQKIGDDSLAAHRAYQRAVDRRLEAERIWAGNVQAGINEAFAVIRALKAENAALAHYNRVLMESWSAITRETPASGEIDNPLTIREHEVLDLIVFGKSTKEIAFLLGIAFKTAACHRYRIMSKLGVHSAAELIRGAVQRGFASL